MHAVTLRWELAAAVRDEAPGFAIVVGGPGHFDFTIWVAVKEPELSYHDLNI